MWCFCFEGTQTTQQVGGPPSKSTRISPTFRPSVLSYFPSPQRNQQQAPPSFSSPVSLSAVASFTSKDQQTTPQPFPTPGFPDRPAFPDRVFTPTHHQPISPPGFPTLPFNPFTPPRNKSLVPRGFPDQLFLSPGFHPNISANTPPRPPAAACPSRSWSTCWTPGTSPTSWRRSWPSASSSGPWRLARTTRALEPLEPEPGGKNRAVGQLAMWFLGFVGSYLGEWFPNFTQRLNC